MKYHKGQRKGLRYIRWGGRARVVTTVILAGRRRTQSRLASHPEADYKIVFPDPQTKLPPPTIEFSSPVKELLSP